MRVENDEERFENVFIRLIDSKKKNENERKKPAKIYFKKKKNFFFILFFPLLLDDHRYFFQIIKNDILNFEFFPSNLIRFFFFV